MRFVPTIRRFSPSGAQPSRLRKEVVWIRRLACGTKWPFVYPAPEMERLVGSHLRVRRWTLHESMPWVPVVAAHRGLELAWTETGELHYRVHTRDFRVGPGALMVVPPGVEHATTFSGDCRAGSLWVACETVDRLCNDAGIADAQLAVGTSPPSLGLTLLAKQVQEEAFAADAQGQMAAEKLMEGLILRLYRAHPKEASGAHSPGIRRALALMTARYAESVSIDDLARAAAMSPFYFSRCFRKEVGMSPYAKLQQIRLNRAAAMLRQGGVTVTEAALSCGYGDLGRFSRKFRQQFGCAPKAMAEGSRKQRLG